MNTSRPITLLLFLFSSLVVHSDAPPPLPPGPYAKISVDLLLHERGGGCVSLLRVSQIMAAPKWDPAAPIPLPPAKAEAIAKKTMTAFCKRHSKEGDPVRFRHRHTLLMKHDADRWYYILGFTQFDEPIAGFSDDLPVLELYVTFDGKIGPFVTDREIPSLYEVSTKPIEPTGTSSSP